MFYAENTLLHIRDKRFVLMLFIFFNASFYTISFNSFISSFLRELTRIRKFLHEGYINE